MASDESRVLDYFKKLKERLEAGRSEVIRTTAENTFYWLGFQWVEWDPHHKGFRRTNTAARVPRPVTNLYKPKLGKVISMLSAIEPALGVSPGTDSPDDRLTADAAKPVLNYLERVVNMDALRLELAYIVAVTNNAWVWVDYDPEEGELKRIPKWECSTNPQHVVNATEAITTKLKCPEDGAPMLPSSTKFDEESVGAVSCEVMTSLEMWCDYTLRMKDQPAMFRRRLRPLEWIRQRGGKKRDASESSAGDLGLMYRQNIIRLAPALGGIVGGANFKNQAIVDDIIIRPCHEFPKGKIARIIAEEEVLEEKDLPYHDGPSKAPGRRILPVTHWGYDYIPASPMLCTGPADFLKSPQRERNRLQSHMMLYSSRSANGVWWLPEGIDVAQLTGIEGTVLRGQTTAAGGGEPKRIEGGRLPTFYQTRLAEIEEEMNMIVMIESLHDQAPRVDNARAIALLQQERQQSLNPVYRRWGQSYAELGRNLFYVFRSFAPDEIWYKVKGEEARWSMRKVQEAELRGGVDINIEQGSIEPKTSLQKQAMTEQMIEYKLVDLTDPATRLKVAKLLGGTELMTAYAADEEAIAREQAAIIEWDKANFNPETGEVAEGVDPMTLEAGFPVHIDPDFDIHALHIARHRVWSRTEEYAALNPTTQNLFRVMHYNAHRQAEMMEVAMQEQAAAEAAAPQDEGQQPPKKGGKGGKSKSKGGASKQEEATNGGPPQG